MAMSSSVITEITRAVAIELARRYGRRAVRTGLQRVKRKLRKGARRRRRIAGGT